MRKRIVPKSSKSVKRKEERKTHKSVEEVASHRWGPPRYIYDPDIIQKILDHIDAQLPPIKRAAIPS